MVEEIGQNEIKGKDVFWTTRILGGKRNQTDIKKQQEVAIIHHSRRRAAVNMDTKKTRKNIEKDDRKFRCGFKEEWSIR